MTAKGRSNNPFTSNGEKHMKIKKWLASLGLIGLFAVGFVSEKQILKQIVKHS